MPNRQNQARHILLIDPDEAFGQALQQVLGPSYTLRRVSDAASAIGGADANQADVILLNLDLNSRKPGVDDSFVLLQASSEWISAPPVIVYGWKSRQRAVEAFQHGAVDFLEQPLDVHALKFAVDGAYRRTSLVRDLATARQFLTSTRVEGLLGNSKAMEQVLDVVNKVAGVQTSVLITGESGTGNGVVARAIHSLSPRANRSFVAFSACAFPDSLIEDELFGHEKGAFTGASQGRRGRFEEAKGGRIFLDEIGD